VERPSKGTLNGRRDKGNGLREMVSALWLSKGSLDAAAQQAAASRRERFRSCSCSGSLCLSEELAEQGVVELVAASCCADQHTLLNEACEMLSMDFPSEVMRWNITFGEARELVREPEFFRAKLGNIGLEFFTT